MTPHDIRATRLRTAEATLIGGLLTVLSTVVGLALGAEMPPGLELAAVFTSYACTYLCVVQSRTNYIWGAISCALYVLVFWRIGLLASASVNAYLLGCLVYGWFRWGPDRSTRPVHHVSAGWLPAYAVGTMLVWAAAVMTVDALGGQMSRWDSAILAGTVLAQFLLDNKKIETWLVWVAVNVVAIWVYWQAGLTLVVSQYVFFLGNAVVAYFLWRREMRESEWLARETTALRARMETTLHDAGMDGGYDPYKRDLG